MKMWNTKYKNSKTFP